MKKTIIKVFAVAFACMLTFTAVGAANKVSTGLSYTYSGSWKKGFIARITESGGSPTIWKQVSGHYNQYDSDSGKTSGWYSFTSPSVQGQLSYSRTAQTGYSMNRVNCDYYAPNYIGSWSLQNDIEKDELTHLFL